MAALRAGLALLASSFASGATATLLVSGHPWPIGSLLFVPCAAAALSFCERDTRTLTRSLFPAFLFLIGASIVLLILALFLLDVPGPVSEMLGIPMEAVGYLVPSGHDFVLPAGVWIVSMVPLVLAAAILLAIVRLVWRRGRDQDQGSR
ncbi:MAG: hypothetical protein QOI38_152 [Sphingomonadales bacterium]|jgi:Na+-driven multidrug efflux pump|nr:hypothetical protein [Sphingomonadales bacterium]